MTDKRPIDLSFPVKGFDENWAYKVQPEGTTPDCLNVRPYDVLGQRLRGGQRAGVSKYIPTQPNGSNPIQLLHQEPKAASGFTESFPYADGTIFDAIGAPWRHYASPFSPLFGTPAGGVLPPLWAANTAYVIGQQIAHSATEYIVKANFTSGGSFSATNLAVYSPTTWITSHSYAIGKQVIAPDGKYYICLILHTSSTFATDLTNGDWQEYHPIEWITAKSYVVGDQVLESGSTYVCVIAHISGTFATDLAAVRWEAYTPLADPATIVGNKYQVTDVVPAPPTLHIAQKPTPTGDMTAGITITHSGVVDDSCYLGVVVRADPVSLQGYQVIYQGPVVGSGSPPFIYVYDELGNSVFTASLGGFPQTWAPNGAAPGQTTQNTPVRLVVAVEDSNMRVYLNGVLVGQILGTVGHTTNKYAGFVAYANPTAGNIYDLSDFSVSGAASNTGSSGRLLAASLGTLFTGVAGGSWGTVGGTFVPAGIIRARTAFGKVYLCDGVTSHYQVYDPATQSVVAWVPTANTLPVGVSDPSLAATIIALYRGRIVLAGLADDPQDWFMSKAGDPLDWNYGATPSAVMAVAGNNSTAGLVGDRITCLAPANDDLMVMGGDHTLWMMRGDPADGGRIDNISSSVGIIGPDAAAYDPSSVLYFFGDGVLWRLSPQGELTPLSRGRMDKTFGAIDFATNTMRLLWDNMLHGLHIFVTPTVSGPAAHYWWDARTDSFWPEKYPDSYGPTAVLAFDADAQNDRAFLLGGQDGYVRQVDASSKTDDGVTILSRIKFGPMTPGSVHQSFRVNRVTTLLDQDSDPVSVRVYAEESPEEAVKSTTIAWSHLFSPVDRYSIPRISGNTLLLEFVNDSFSAAWATGTDYIVGSQVVASDGNPYVSLTVHTSTDSGTDLHPTPPGNTTDWVLSSFRSWALETVAVIADVTGRTKHRRI